MLNVPVQLQHEYGVCPLVCFQALEQSLDSLALTSFGLMDTTLEEVFLKVSEEDQSLEDSDTGEAVLVC